MEKLPTRIAEAVLVIAETKDEGKLKAWLDAENAKKSPRKGIVGTLREALGMADEVVTEPTNVVPASMKKPVHDKETGTVKVLSLVNMMTKGADEKQGELKKGKVCEITESEYKRLLVDVRGPFWEGDEWDKK